MNNIKVCLDRVGCTSKPNGAAIGQISNRIASQPKRLGSDNIRSFVGDVGLGGHTFTPATFRGRDRKKESFEQMQMFVLDFDNDTPDKQISFEDVKERAETYNLPILFAYESFNSKDRNRFRVALRSRWR